MPSARLGLPTPAGTALVSTGDNDITSLATILDRAALWLVPGTFAARPAAAGNDGRFYLATDVLILYVSDGTNWHEVSRLGGTPPIGSLMDYAGGSDPADTRWLLADGRAISRSTYAAAFAVMGTTYGAGDTTTTFNIPDFRGRTSVAPDNMGGGAAGRMASNNTRGAVGGTETKTLVSGNLPAHTHDQGTLVTASNGAHDHGVGTLATASDGAHTHGVGTLATATAGSHSHGGSTGGATASLAHVHDYLGGPSWYNAGSTGIQAFNNWPNGDIGMGAGFTSTAFGSTPDHGHVISADGGHTHALSGLTASAGAHTHALSGAVATAGAHTHAITGATGSVGAGTAFNGMPPYVVVNKIIRVS